MARGAWFAYVGLIWLFLFALAVQTFLAGLGLFAGAERMQLHRDVGWFLHLPILLILVAALLARVGRPTIWWVLALFLMGAVQPFLPGLRADLPLVAALHPLTAVAMTLITVKLALDTLPRMRAPSEA
jgi:bacteriorhodopsin